MLWVSVLCLFAFLLAFVGADRLAGMAGLFAPAEGLGTRATRGAALLVVLGGVLMVASLADATGTAILVAFFAIVGLATLAQRAFRPFSTGSLLLACLLGVFLVAAIALPPSFNAVDDGFAYLALIRDVAASGGGHAQPFSERRLFTYGGHFPFSGLVEHVAGPEALSVIDPGLGLALVGLLLLERVRGGRMPAWAGVGALALVVVTVIGFSPIKNTIPILLPLAFATLMAIRILEHDGKARPRLSRAVEMGLLAGAATTFRATSLPFALALLGAWCAVESWRALSRRRVPAGPIVAVLAMAATLAPFAWVLWRTSRTPLFPLLGPGIHASRHDAEAFAGGPASQRVAAMLDAVATDPGILLACLAALFGIALALRAHERERAARLALALAAILAASGAVAFATDGVALLRYSFSFTLALPVSVLATARLRPLPTVLGAWRWNDRPAFASLAAVGVLSAGLLAAWLVGPRLREEAGDRLMPRYVAIAPTGQEYVSADAITRIVPAGASILVTWPRAYLLPPGRNRLLLNDQPGRAGPEPLWPSLDDPPAVRAYLRSAGVDFVLASPVPPAVPCTGLEAHAQWYRRIYQGECDFARFVASPAMRQRTVLRDAAAILIDLR